MGDVSERAGCYDRVYDGIAAAAKNGDIAMVDVRSEKARQRQSAPTTVTSRITGLAPNADGSWMVTLANGTAWRTQSNLNGSAKTGQDVTITKDGFSRFRMSSSNGRRTIVYRVR